MLGRKHRPSARGRCRASAARESIRGDAHAGRRPPAEGTSRSVRGLRSRVGATRRPHDPAAAPACVLDRTAVLARRTRRRVRASAARVEGRGRRARAEPCSSPANRASARRASPPSSAARSTSTARSCFSAVATTDSVCRTSPLSRRSRTSSVMRPPTSSRRCSARPLVSSAASCRSSRSDFRGFRRRRAIPRPSGICCSKRSQAGSKRSPRSRRRCSSSTTCTGRPSPRCTCCATYSPATAT